MDQGGCSLPLAEMFPRAHCTGKLTLSRVPYLVIMVNVTVYSMH